MASGNTLAILFPYDNEPPATIYAQPGTRNTHPTLDFDDTVNTPSEGAVFTSKLPSNYAGGGLTVLVTWCAFSAVTGTGGWLVAIERMDTATDIDADSFAADQTITATTVPGTSGFPITTSVAITSGANMDGLLVGETFRIRIRRDVASDNAVGDIQLLSVEIKET